MKNDFENMNLFDELPLNITISSIKDSSSIHWHTYIMIFFVLSGKLTITMDAETYYLSEDDIILINSEQAYLVKEEENVTVSIQINPSFYQKTIDKNITFQCNSAAYCNKSKFYKLKRIISQMVYVHFNEIKDKDFLLLSHYYQLIFHLLQNFQSNRSQSRNRINNSLPRFSNILQYLHENYSEKITLEQVSEREYLSPSYLSHLFKENMGTTFFNYLTGIRLSHAATDLKMTSLSIEQVSANNGFANSRYFVNAFKKQYGLLPKQYRTNYKEEKKKERTEDTHTKYQNELLIPRYDLLNRLGEYFESANSSDAVKPLDENLTRRIEITVTDNKKRLGQSYKTFTSVGRAKDLLRDSIRKQLTTVQKEIGFHYIKFHGILDDSMMLYNEDSHGNPYLTYQYVDQAIDFLLSIQLKPLIQLSFMPRQLAKDPTNTIFYTPTILSEPKDLSKWAFLITNLTKHFIERYGNEEVRSWLFSFWNVPFKECMFAFDSMEITCNLYQITRDSVKSCDPNIKFGSPSYGSLNHNSPEYYIFLDYCKENDCFPDFYNLNLYPVKRISSKKMATFGVCTKEDSIILSDDKDYLMHSLDRIKKRLSAYPKLPIYITEWAFTTSHRDWLSDTCYRSAYIIKNILENYDCADSFGSWCLSDELEELPFDNELFHGELGLFATGGIKKPAYYAYTFLNKLMSTLVDSGPGYFITTNLQGSFVILLYNYVHISPMYAQGILFNVTFIERYNAFVNPSTICFDLVLNSIENGSYTVTEHIVNRHHGSAFDEWVRMGALPLTTEEEFRTLQGRSMPKITKSVMEIQGDKLNYYAELEPHEIRLVELTRAN